MSTIQLQNVATNKALQRVEKKLLHYTGKAISQYKMIEPNDRVLVCVSGGKDSLALLVLLNILLKRARKKFEITAFVLNQSQPGFNPESLKEFFLHLGVPFEILKKDIYSIVKQKLGENKMPCSLCSRLRRGNIYRYAKEKAFNKIALGHHRDDLIESLLMSILYNGRISSMPPKLISDDKENIVIRPLSLCQEKDIKIYAQLKRFPILPCNYCGVKENMARKRIKALISDLEAQNPKIPSNILRSMQSVHLSQLMDKKHWDFNNF